MRQWRLRVSPLPMRNRVSRKGVGLGLLLCLLGGLPATAAESVLSFEEAVTQADQAPLVTAALASEHVKRELDAHVSRLPFNPQLGAQAGYRRELTAQGVAG